MAHNQKDQRVEILSARELGAALAAWRLGHVQPHAAQREDALREAAEHEDCVAERDGLVVRPAGPPGRRRRQRPRRAAVGAAPDVVRRQRVGGRAADDERGAVGRARDRVAVARAERRARGRETRR